jgi:hypothetical protein
MPNDKSHQCLIALADALHINGRLFDLRTDLINNVSTCCFFHQVGINDRRWIIDIIFLSICCCVRFENLSGNVRELLTKK